MAKKVNYKFVIILGSTLVVLGVGFVGLKMWNRWSNSNPVTLRAQAEAAEKSGDLIKAAGYYNRAADILASEHTPGADILYVKLSDISDKLSSAAKSPEEGIKYWQLSDAALQRALAENPHNTEVTTRLLDNKYQQAQIGRNAVLWQGLEELVSKALKNTQLKDAKPYMYRAEAILEWAKQLTSDAPDSRLTAAEEDIKKARSLDPDSGKAAKLYGDLLAFKARRADKRGAQKDSEELWDAFDKDMRAFLEKHPNDPEVVIILASNLANQAAAIHHPTTPDKLDNFPNTPEGNQQRKQAADAAQAARAAKAKPKYEEAIDLAQKAYAAHPDSKQVGELLGGLYGLSDPPAISARVDLAGKVYKEMLAAAPDSPEAHARMAAFYRVQQQLPEAIAEYKEVNKHVTAGGGVEAILNENWMLGSYEAIASLNLDLAEKDPESESGKAQLAEAASYIEKLRVSHVRVKGIMDLLDGHVQLIKRNMPQAIKLLSDAEANLAREPGMNERLMHTRIFLAQANERLQQPGKALDYIDRAMQNQRSPGLILWKAGLLNSLRRFDETKALLNPETGLLKFQDRLPVEMANRARQLLAAAQGTQDAIGTIENIQSPAAQLQLAGILLGENENEKALDVATRLIEQQKDKPNQLAIYYAVLANVRLNQKDEALKLLDLGLAKYPGNSQFEMKRKALTTKDINTPEAQLEIINSISDEYLKQLQLSTLYRSQANPDKEIEALRAAEASLGEPTTVEGNDRLADVIDRIFTASAVAASTAKDDAAKAKFWRICDDYVRQAERRNLDGVNGKLYRGRLELMRSDGTQGLSLVEQAVSQRPDYAVGRSILGRAYYNQKPPRYDAALNEFRQAVQIVPNEIGMVRATIELLLRRPDSSNIQEAQTLLKNALLLSPQDPRLMYFHDLIGDLPQAIASREAKYKANPGDVDNIRRLTMLYIRNKNNDKNAIDKAIELVKPLVEKDKKDLQTVGLLAGLYAAKDQVDEGIKLFEPYVAASADAKDRYQALLALGEFCRSKQVKRIDPAVKAFKEAMALQDATQDDAERHLGDLYFDIDDMAHAESVYQSILAKKTDSASRNLVARRVIETQIRQRKFDDAERGLQNEIFKNSPDDAQGLVLRALLRIEQQRFKDALADLNVVIAKHNDNGDAYFYRALTQFSMPDGDLDQAISDLQVVKSRDAMAINARSVLTRVYRKARRFGDAANEYAEILKLDQDNYGVRQDYAAFLMSLVEAQVHLPKAAVDDVASSLRLLRPAERLQALLAESQKLYSDKIIWVLMQAQLLGLQGNNFEAQRFYQAIYRAIPDDPGATNYYLGSLLQTQNYPEVVEISTKLLAKQPDVLYIYYRRAKAYAAMNKVEEAAKDLDYGFDLGIRGSRETKSYEPFLAAMSQALEVAPPAVVADRLRVRVNARPEEAVSAIGLMHVLTAMGQSEEASQVLSKIKVPEGDVPLKAMYLKEAATVRYGVKDYEGSAKSYLEYLALVPEDMEALNNYSYMLAESLNKPQEAVKYAQQAVNLLETRSDPSTYISNQATYYDTLGWVKCLAKDYAGAKVDLTKSINAQPMPTAYYHLAKSLVATKNLNDAYAAVQSGLQVDPKSKDPVMQQLEELKKELTK